MLVLGDATDLDALRLRGEFGAMPGLVINSSQVARLLDVRVQHAIELLDALEKDGFLIRMTNGSYRRAYPLSA
jgi:predicted transcriptional regulator of viral defense system